MFKPLYKSLIAKLKFFKEYLNKNLKKEFIKKLQFLITSLILFMPKFNSKEKNSLHLR